MCAPTLLRTVGTANPVGGPSALEKALRSQPGQEEQVPEAELTLDSKDEEQQSWMLWDL